VVDYLTDPASGSYSAVFPTASTTDPHSTFVGFFIHSPDATYPDYGSVSSPCSGITAGWDVSWVPSGSYYGTATLTVPAHSPFSANTTVDVNLVFYQYNSVTLTTGFYGNAGELAWEIEFSASGSTLSAPCMVQGIGGRPLCVEPGSGLSGVFFYASSDAWHSFSSHSVSSSSPAADPSLIVDFGCGPVRCLYGDNSSVLYLVSALDDGESVDWLGPVGCSISGTYPVCCQSPADYSRVVLCYLDGSGGLQCSCSFDLGSSWISSSLVDSGLDFSLTGRPGLVFFGSDVVVVVYCSGAVLLARFSLDGGFSWGSSVVIGSSGPYTNITLVSGVGSLFLVAVCSAGCCFWTSDDHGSSWVSGSGPPVSYGALLFERESGRLFLGIAGHVSPDAGASWVSP
jgi:hypothetical protein